MRSAAIGAAWVLGILGGLAGLLSWVVSGGAKADAAYVYKTDGEIRLTLSVFRPGDWSAVDRRPCIIWFFGGGFESGSPAQFFEASRRLARSGLVAIAADYRVRLRHGAQVAPADALADARDALRWVREHAAELGIDPGLVAMGGGSSGGYLALACAALEGTDAPAALVLFNPVADFDIPYVRERVNGAEFERLMTISPIQQLHRPLPPALILHGSADRIVPADSVERFVEKARQFGSSRIDWEALPGRDHEFHLHGFDGNRGYEFAMTRAERFFRELGWIDPAGT